MLALFLRAHLRFLHTIGCEKFVMLYHEILTCILAIVNKKVLESLCCHGKDGQIVVVSIYRLLHAKFCSIYHVYFGTGTLSARLLRARTFYKMKNMM